jgi:hypothetical protein
MQSLGETHETQQAQITEADVVRDYYHIKYKNKEAKLKLIPLLFL